MERLRNLITPIWRGDLWNDLGSGRRGPSSIWYIFDKSYGAGIESVAKWFNSSCKFNFTSQIIMFTIPRANLYKSSDGFSVEVLGRSGLCYREEGKKMFIDAEVIMGAAGIVIYSATIDRWDYPHNKDIVDEVERERILNNIRQAFRWQGFEIQVI